MLLAILAFIGVFVLIAAGGLLLFYREAMMQRVTDVVLQSPKRGPLMGTIQQTGISIGSMVGNLDRVVPKTGQEKSALSTRLARAGYRDESATRFLYGAKVAAPLLFLAICAASGLMQSAFIFAMASSLGLGYIVPDFWLSSRIKARQKKITSGLPDALDFMVICIEAGLSTDQAISRTADELKISHPAISDELEVLVLQQRAGRARSDAWRQFAERTDVEAVRVLATVLIQAEQLGTSIARTLRIHSELLRTHHRQNIEEQAAKTSVKLVFPLVLFIFPSLFLVVLGPEMIMMMEAFHNNFTH